MIEPDKITRNFIISYEEAEQIKDLIEKTFNVAEMTEVHIYPECFGVRVEIESRK